MSTHSEETALRRTFAIISHPDAGKTTITEKLLLFGGAIQLAGTVKGRKAARHATSDWMAMEKERERIRSLEMDMERKREQIVAMEKAQRIKEKERGQAGTEKGKGKTNWR